MAIETPTGSGTNSAGVFAVERIGKNEVILRLEASESSVVLEFFKQAASALVAGEKSGTFILRGRPESGEKPSAAVPEILIGPEAIEGGRIPETVRGHLGRLNLEAAVQQLLAAIRQTYPNPEKIDLSVFRDEFGEERVKVNALVAEEGDEETAKYFACLGKWSDAVSPEAAERIIFTTS